MRVPFILLASFCIVFCTRAKADTIDHLTLTTSLFGATNVTAITYVEGQLSDKTDFIPVTIDSDPATNGRLQYNGYYFVLDLYKGSQFLLEYYGVDTSLGTHTYLSNALTFTFTPGTYYLGQSSVTLQGNQFEEELDLDSAVLNIVQDAPTVPPTTPVAPAPGLTAVTPEPSSIVLLGTGLLGMGAFLRRRVPTQA